MFLVISLSVTNQQPSCESQAFLPTEASQFAVATIIPLIIVAHGSTWRNLSAWSTGGVVPENVTWTSTLMTARFCGLHPAQARTSFSVRRLEYDEDAVFVARAAGPLSPPVVTLAHRERVSTVRLSRQGNWCHENHLRARGVVVIPGIEVCAVTVRVIPIFGSSETELARLASTPFARTIGVVLYLMSDGMRWLGFSRA